YLRKKFFIFSQFMFDEHIKARLIKDRRHFLENHVEGGARTRCSHEGLTFLDDHFRLLITQIGNAMGYVRMIRSGGLNCCSSAIRFVPDLEDIPAFEELASKAGLSQGTVTAAQQLDQTVAGLVKNYSEGHRLFRYATGTSDISREFALLDQGLTSARIFFRAEKEAAEAEAAEEVAAQATLQLRPRHQRSQRKRRRLRL
uniref:WASH-7_mid domain-containing protein n=1 Tax=Macrostomum lignano TaxID=282301 RepID=A0A1I8FIR3_9PLAT